MKNTQSLLLIFLLLVFSNNITAQQTTLSPTNWWVGMQWNKVQILIYNKEKSIKNCTVKINYPGVSISKITPLENEKYIALDVVIAANTKPGIVQIELKNKNNTETISWPIDARRKGNGTTFAKGVRSEDLIYLLMPDRFSNGDYSNDKIAGLKDQSLNRDSMYHRHGGDLQGVINKLDYLKDLGVTTVWMTPVLLNDMPDRTEHGYAITDHYKVDERIGGAKAYKNLSNELHKRGMKLIQDAIYNHVGIKHFTVEDKPMRDWLHEWPTFTQTSYKEQTIFDPYAAASQTKRMVDGWFVTAMPDMNQSNPYVANYLIQNALWSVEEFGVDGWRIDTYTYNDMPFMNKCNKALTDEYPNITMYGETWVHGVANQSYFCQNNMDVKAKSNLQNTTDFQTLFYGIQPALNEKFGWTDGVTKLYNTASQDFLYKNPMGEVIFLGNHDLSRFYSMVDENVAKYKIALGWLLTFRGVPQLYYGDEILMTGKSNPDGLVRADFMGGWKEDKQNKFTQEGRTEKENDVFNYLKTLANFRLKSTALKTGKMMQYIPENGLYTYFRYDDKQIIICIMNTSDEEKTIDAVTKYADIVKGFTSMKNVITGEEKSLQVKIAGKEMLIAILQK
jgi:neopullulanase